MTKILHLILIIISIINILIIKLKNIKRLNYFIFISKTNTSFLDIFIRPKFLSFDCVCLLSM